MPLNSLTEGIKKFFGKNDKRARIVLILGIAGIVMIGLSQFWPSGEKKTSTEIGTASADTEAYKTKLEKRVEEMISSVKGVGNARVMITLESGIEYIYEKEQNVSSTLNEDHTQEGGAKIQQSEDSKESFIIVEDANGRKTALVRKQLEPQIQGVVIVCEGGGNAVVAKNIYDLVTTALGIGYDRVCVVKSN